MKPKHMLMLAGLIGATGLALFGDKSPDIELVEPVSRPTAMVGEESFNNPPAVADAPQTEQGAAEIHILALLPRVELETGTNRGLFSGKSWTPPPAAVEFVPPPAPTAPPLPYTYLGKQLGNGRMEVYLARGDEVFVVHEQSVIQNTYRVEAIKPPILSLVYLPLNQIQRLSIGVIN